MMIGWEVGGCNSTKALLTTIITGVAASMAACLTHPLDLTKVRMQTMAAKDRQNMLKTMIMTVRDQGWYIIELRMLNKGNWC